jgi:SAM-dependent methyltransferase
MNAVISTEERQIVQSQIPFNEATSSDSPSFWEQTAETRWGRYMTSIERHALQLALSRYAEPGLALEVGCEGGRWTRLLCDLGWKMLATDIDPHTLELCHQRNPSVRCMLVREQDDKFPVGPGAIDLLVTIQVPVVDCPWFSREASRALATGGAVVGTFNNLLSWRGVMSNLKSAITGRPCYYPKSYSAFRKSMLEQGFSIDYERGYCWGPFGRHSNSKLIPLAANLERSLQAHRMTHVSPWVVFVATRR